MFITFAVWTISKDNNRWIECSKGPCTCLSETKSISCWQQNMPSLPSEQVIPHDVTVMLVTVYSKPILNLSKFWNFRDLGMNKLTTINKDAFKHLLFLTELEIFDNELDYLPETIFDDLEDLKYLWVYSEIEVTWIIGKEWNRLESNSHLIWNKFQFTSIYVHSKSGSWFSVCYNWLYIRNYFSCFRLLIWRNT